MKMKAMNISAGILFAVATTCSANPIPSVLAELDHSTIKVLDQNEVQDIQGAGWSPNGFPRGQCTWWADGRANERGWRLRFSSTSGRNAYKWWDMVTNANKGQLGLSGDIMVLDRWTGNAYGHVGIVETSVTRGSSWKVSHANWNAGSVFRYVEGVPIRMASVKKVSPGRVSFGGTSSYPLRGFLYKR